MGNLRTMLSRSFCAATVVSKLLKLATLILWPVPYYRLECATYGIGEDIASVGVN